MRLLLSCAIIVALSVSAFGEASYTGYSGAPGSRGSCAGTCHGRSGGTVIVEGFPATYNLGQSYEVWLHHGGGSRIRNFNGSVRIGTGSETAGQITAGLNTSTYSRTQEPNGVHLSSSNQDSCSFNWTAPSTGVGDVRLYIAGLQGGESGQNTELVIVSGQGTGIEDEPRVFEPGLALSAEPSVVTTSLVLRVVTPSGQPAVLLIVDRAGRVMDRVVVPGSDRSNRLLARSTVDADGDPLESGVYFAALESAGDRIVRKFVVKDN